MIKKLWNKVNGKKLLTGLIVTGIGYAVGEVNVPVVSSFSTEIMYAGFSISGIGGGHKLQKRFGNKFRDLLIKGDK